MAPSSKACWAVVCRISVLRRSGWRGSRCKRGCAGSWRRGMKSDSCGWCSVPPRGLWCPGFAHPANRRAIRGARSSLPRQSGTAHPIWWWDDRLLKHATPARRISVWSTCSIEGINERMKAWSWLPIVAQLALTATVAAQATLSAAADRARQAWSAHDPEALVGRSSSIVLQIPGADPSSPLGRAQAIELLRRYLRPAEERGLDIATIREVEPGKGFVELTRRYVVAGTTEMQRETLFLGYRLQSNEWRLAELRNAP